MQRPTSFQMDGRLTEKRRLNDRYVLLIFQLPIPLTQVQAGQFVQVKVDGSPHTLLRRPISICLLPKPDALWLLVQEVGEGTTTLCALEPGAMVNMLLPLGTGFTAPSLPSTCLLVGGGVGVAPMLMLGQKLAEAGHQVVFLLGGRTRTDLVMQEHFARYGKVYVTTEDGSLGEKGFVTQHSLLNEPHFDAVYTCGPKPMMKAVATFAAQHDITCQVSLENLMACGIGACLCCVEDTVDGHVCTCTEGPVFNTKRLKW